MEAKYNLWKRKEDLKNTKKVVAEFEERKQERLNMVEKRDFRREKLPEKYIAKILYRQNNRKFKNKYLKKLAKNW